MDKAMKSITWITEQLKDSYKIKRELYENKDLQRKLADIATEMVQVYQKGNKTVFAGNGGSAGDAQHMAGELVGRFYFHRPALPSLALTTNTSVLTAIANDYDYETIFVRQLEAHGKPGDLFFGLSTSGNSPNILKALEFAQKKGIKTVAFTGAKASKMLELSNYSIQVPSNETPRVQETHLLLGHILCSIVERELFGKVSV